MRAVPRTPGPDPRRHPVDRTPDTTFASSSLARHLLRGALGLALLVGALALLPALGPLSLLLLLPAGLALRGCPTCWTLGLLQTLALTRGDCADGRCPEPSPLRSARR